MIGLRRQARNQPHAPVQWPVVVASARRQCDGRVADLDARIATVERESGLVLTDGARAASAAYSTSAPGIGAIAAAWLLVATGNSTLASGPEALAADAGPAPMPRQAGTSVHGSAGIGHAGNGQLRGALYPATLSAARYNPAIKPLDDRQRAAGKPVKVARCAAARKRLHLSRAPVTKRQPFDPQHRQPDQAETSLASRQAIPYLGAGAASGCGSKRPVKIAT